MQMTAMWWCEKCRHKLSKEITKEEREGMKPLIMFVCGTCEGCSE
jgi:hypothetical protein